MSVPAATIRDILESWLNQPYDQGPGRDDPNHYGHDCSGYMAAGWTAAHAGRTDGYVIANLSWSIFEQCAAAGLVVPWDDAYLNLPAVLRWMPQNPDYPDGAGDGGHVGCTDGRGNMLESWGGAGCSRTTPNFETWDGYAGFFCDTDYTGHGIQPAPQRKQVDQDMFLASSTTSNGQPEGIRRWVFDDDGATQISDSMGTNLGNTMAYAGDIDALQVVAWNIAHGRNPDGTHK